MFDCSADSNLQSFDEYYLKGGSSLVDISADVMTLKHKNVNINRRCLLTRKHCTLKM